MSLRIDSPDLPREELVPERFRFGPKSSNPRLRIFGVPQGTRELALLCEDPDSPPSRPTVHWILYELDPSIREITPGLKKRPNLEVPFHAKQGLNSFYIPGYMGPNPNFWHRPHRISFRVFALREKLNLPPKTSPGKFLSAIDSLVLDEAELLRFVSRSSTPRRAALWAIAAGATGILVSEFYRRKAA